VATLRESFGLMEYSEGFIEKIVSYRMYPDKELNRYLTYEEIAVREKCTSDEVRKILTATAIVWIY